MYSPAELLAFIPEILRRYDSNRDSMLSDEGMNVLENMNSVVHFVSIVNNIHLFLFTTQRFENF